MSPRTASVYPLYLDLDGSRSEPLYRQIYRGIKEGVLSGRLKPGIRLPSTRDLADELGVSRNTVIHAFRQLVAEGFLESRVGSGTRVAADLAPQLVGAGEREEGLLRGARRISERWAGASAILSPTPSPAPTVEARAFQPGVPALELFPRATWARLAGRRWRAATFQQMSYGSALGDPDLREAIAEYVGSVRGVSCEADQVLVLGGSQEALDLAARVLTDPGDRAWMEDPGYPGVRGALAAAGARIVPVPVDEEGLRVKEGRRTAPEARLVCVSPSHQFPLGVTMSLPRRLALLRWATESGAWIVEDDYDSEYRYAGTPLMALQGLDADRRVLYVGTFSKTLCPALRVGYIVLPPDLVEPFGRARSVIDQHSPTFVQVTLADFIREGHFARHIRKMLSVYEARRDALLKALERQLAGIVDVISTDTGLHLVARLARGVDDRLVADAAASRDVTVFPLSRFHADPPERGGLLLGYGAVDEEAIGAGVERLAAAIEDLHGRQ